MRRLLTLTLAITAALAPSAAAQVPGGLMSDNIEFVKNFLRHTDSAGATLHNGLYYVTTERDLSIYDVRTDPENPSLVGNVILENPGTPVFTEEDPETNGRILAVTNDGLLIYDVQEKSAPKVIGRLPGLEQHTISCVLDCTYLYGSEGAVVDLRDPTKPKLVGNWREAAGVPTTSTHDVTEVARGLVVTSTEPILTLDVQADPTQPRVLAVTQSKGFVHANLWPQKAKDRFLLVGGESTGPQCSQDASATFSTYDTVGWMGSKAFRLAGEFTLANGTIIDGRNVDSTFCVHWHQQHPKYANGGMVAIAWYEQGIRLLKVGREGQIEEMGYWLPLTGQSSDVDWVTDRLIYVADYLRGVDILRFTGEVPPSFPFADAPAPAVTPARPAAKPSFGRLVALPSNRRCVRARSFRVKIRRNASDPVRRATLRIGGRRAATASGRALSKGLRARRLPRGRFRAQVEVVTRSGHKTAGQRSYRGCA